MKGESLTNYWLTLNGGTWYSINIDDLLNDPDAYCNSEEGVKYRAFCGKAIPLIKEKKEDELRELGKEYGYFQGELKWTE